MPRLVRRAPLSERLKAYLDPYDFLLWLSEELNDDTYDEWLQTWATTLGIAMNFVFVLARGASKAGTSQGSDDVFGDNESQGSGWFSWMVSGLAIHDRVSRRAANVVCIGSLPRPFHYPPVLRERLLHFLPQTPLPPLRTASEHCANNTVSASRAC